MFRRRPRVHVAESTDPAKRQRTLRGSCHATWLLGNDPGPALPAAANTPSGALALELDWATASPARLSAAELVDAAIGYEHLAAWATAGQQVMLADWATAAPPTAPSAPPPHRPIRHRISRPAGMGGR